MVSRNKTFRQRKRQQRIMRRATPINLSADRLAHDGRGISSQSGKINFIFNALPGESWQCYFISEQARFANYHAQDALQQPHPDRSAPICAHYQECGGCQLQHLKPAAQIQHKQKVLLELLQHQTGQKQFNILPALTGPTQHYRHKARLGVKYLRDSDELIVGFRKRHAPRFIARLQQCPILAQPLADQLPVLRDMLQQLASRAHIPQLEIAISDASCVIIIRHLQALPWNDLCILQHYAQQQQWQLMLQANRPAAICSLRDAMKNANINTSSDANKDINTHKNNDTNSHADINTNTNMYAGKNANKNKNLNLSLHKKNNSQALHNHISQAITPPQSQHVEHSLQLHYQLKTWDLTLYFSPQHFTQINPIINQKMIQQALQLLDLQASDHCLDLFCGIGNFSLPMARFASQVVGVEGSPDSVMQAKHNAQHNRIANAAFSCADLSQPMIDRIDQAAPQHRHPATSMQPTAQLPNWLQQRYDKVLLDPPRCGAAAVIPLLAYWQPQRIVYIACQAASLARDCAAIMQLGYQLEQVGLMDMFPHTQHLEAMVLLTKKT